MEETIKLLVREPNPEKKKKQTHIHTNPTPKLLTDSKLKAHGESEHYKR